MQWHFALSARFELRQPARFIVRSHVLFSQGGTAMIGKMKAQRLRKSLCKNWWNATWRDRLQLSMAYLSQRTDTPQRPLRNYGTMRFMLGDAWADVAARSMSFESVASFQRAEREDEKAETNDRTFDEDFRAPEPPDDDDEGDDK